MAKMSDKDWEGSAKDKAQDLKLAKKHGMSFKKWEASDMDVKHDKQQSTAGLKKGGNMPSTSAKQAKFMQAIAHSPSFAKKVGVKQSVGKDFNMADKKAKKFGNGGTTTKKPAPYDDPDGERIPTKGEAAKMMTPTPLKVQPKKDKDTLGTKKFASGGGVAKKLPTAKQMGGMNMAKGGGIERKGKTSTKMVKMAKGGCR